jgi:hypothetical protein
MGNHHQCLLIYRIHQKMEALSRRFPLSLKDANPGLPVYSVRYRDIPRRRILPAAAQLVVNRSDMDDVLLGIVLQRVRESPLEEQATNLLLAAFESEESLSAQLGG